jgi:hypothetical protein
VADHAEPNGQNASAPNAPPAELVSGNSPPTHRLIVGPLTAAALSLLAGVIVWAMLEAVEGKLFKVPEKFAQVSGAVTQEHIDELDKITSSILRAEATLAMGIVGALAGVLLGTAESWTRISVGRAAIHAPLAAVIGGLIGATAGFTAPLFQSMVLAPASMTPMAKTIAVHAYMFGVLGLGLGLAISVPLLNPRLMLHCVLGCILGGVFAAILYAPLMGYLLPRVRTERLLPVAGAERLIWLAMATTLIGLTVAGLGIDRRKHSAN